MFHHTSVDLDSLRSYRLGRLREQLRRHDVAGIVLYDPVNIRYATDCSNMQVWTMHNAVRYAFVATEGPVVLFDFHNCEHLSEHLPLVDETRPAVGWFFFGAGSRVEERAGTWAGEIADLVRLHGGGNRRLAIDKVNMTGLRALEARGITVVEGECMTEAARLIKSADEIVAMRESIRVCQIGMTRMREALTPGMTKTALWSHLHQANIELGGEWIETRLLASGPRTNPWFHEAGPRVIQAGELVSFDTDLIGPNGYCSDISRSWICGDGPSSNEQATLFDLAQEQIRHNTEILKPGMTWRELVDRSFKLPEAYVPNRYSVVYHGVGLCDEYPAVVYAEDWEATGYDGLVEVGQTYCVESYVGRHGGNEGVKLEQQVLVTEHGAELLSDFPLSVN